MSQPKSGVSERPELHREPFIHLVDLAHDRALIAWGAFWFVRSHPESGWEIVDDEKLPEVAGRHTCIGSDAEPFGHAVVELFNDDGVAVARAETSDKCWVWVDDLAPDTSYRYRVTVADEVWADGELSDWVPNPDGGYDLAKTDRSYNLRFRTWPHPEEATKPFRFVALGDYGVGTRSDSESSRRQRRIAEVLDKVVDDHDVRFVLSLGDNIYKGEFGAVDDESGGEDDDWYSSFFQPYRYAIAQVPVFPAIGNHDTTDTEGSDDRAQMEDNFHIRERFHGEPDRSSIDPGLFYKLQFGRDVELICLDTSQDSEDESVHRFFQEAGHRKWLQRAFAESDVRWRIPFSHHPAYCAGPTHGNDEEILEALVPLFEQGGVQLVLAGHEHNFQISEVGNCTFVVSGAGGKVREEVPEGFESASTTAWSGQSHLLLVEVDGESIQLAPIAGLLPDGALHKMTAMSPSNEPLRPPFTIT
ncbi:MAG: metallophosphoesterase, partial [Candidatus Nanopelagicales bacterium]